MNSTRTTSLIDCFALGLGAVILLLVGVAFLGHLGGMPGGAFETVDTFFSTTKDQLNVHVLEDAWSCIFGLMHDAHDGLNSSAETVFQGV